MPMLHPSPRVIVAGTRWLVVTLSLGLAVWSAGAQATDCQIACRDDSPCVTGNPAGTAKVQSQVLKAATGCELVTATSPIELRYMYKQAWFRPPLVVRGPLRAVFNEYPPDECSLPTPSCIQKLVSQQQGLIAAHPIDNQKSAPGGTDQPCTKGFPCGRVLLPPDTWRFRLSDESTSGKWKVRLARGTAESGRGQELIATIERGIVTADGRWFIPAGQFTYSVTDNSGVVLATGEFSTVSRETQDNLAKLAQRRVAAGDIESIAWTDTLMRNNLPWNAMQETP